MFPELTTLQLPALPFKLPEHVGLANIDRFQALARILEKQVIKGSSSSRAMVNRIAEYERQRIASCGQSPECLLREPRDVRLLIGWWSSDPQTRLKRLPMSAALLDRCIALKPQLSLQALFGLIRLFFECFDEIEELPLLGQLLQQQLALRERSRGAQSSLSILTQNRLDLFCPDGSKWLVDRTVRQNQTLDAVADRVGIADYANGRFYQHCQQLYYLETLSTLEVGQDHAILNELARREVHDAPFDKGLLLGHEVVRRMVDKAAGRGELAKNWLNLILSIAGDPRVSKSSANFTKWWARLEHAQVKQVRRWLSRMDLGLFLKVLEEYSDYAGADMQRMFPARERFLRGLFDAELISESRLFLSRRADQFVRSYYQDQKLPSYATNSDAERSVFYLSIGDVHVFEGTHNFYFWIHAELPPNSPAEYGNTNSFNIRELGMGLGERVSRMTGRMSFHVAHNGDWQHSVIEGFRSLGINIDPSAVLTNDDYRNYRRRYGVS